MLASQPVVTAALRTCHMALIFLRNYALHPNPDPECINELADALHAVPEMASAIEYFKGGEAELLATIKMHLAGFQHWRWPGSPNLVEVFEDELSRA